MISFFRRLIGSKLGAGLALLFLLLIAFAFAAGDVSSTGGFGSLTSFGSGTNTKIGGQSLSESEVQSRVQRVFEQQRRENPGMQIGEFLAMGAVPEIYDQLVASLTVQEFARKQGVHVSKRMIDAEIAKIPAFQDATGKFSQSAFRQLLSSQNVSEQALRDDIAKQLSAELMLAPAGFGTHLPDSLVLPYASLLLEARSGRIAAIPSAAFLPKDKPTDAQLKDFYKRNAERYTLPEQRKLRYAVIETARFDAAAKPTDDEIAKYFADQKADYAARENRSISRLILPTENAAKTAAAQASLAAAAQSNGLSVAKLDKQTQEEFAKASSTEAAKLVFAAPKGKVVGPVKLPLGWAVFETREIETIAAKTLEAVKPEIVAALSVRKRKTLLSELIAKIEDGIANGGTFDETVKNNDLKVVQTPAIISNGNNVSDRTYRPEADVEPLLKPAFEMEADDDAQVVMISPDERYALLDVTDIIAAAPPPLEELKPLVTQQYMLHEGAAKARTVAEKIRSEVAKGKTLEKAMADAGTPLPPVQKVAGRRADLLRTDKRTPAEISIMFAMAKGSIKAVPIPQEQGTFLVMLDDIQQGDAAKVDGLVDRVRGDIGKVASREYSDQLEKAMERDLGVDRKASVISRVTQELQRANGGATK